MTGMNIQDRYDDIASKSGLSEEIVRRVLKASRESLAFSLKKGERATLPGICTFTPEIKNRINIGGESMTSYIKLKSSPSSAMESELSRVDKFESIEDIEAVQKEEDNRLSMLNFQDSKISFGDNSSNQRAYGIRTTQINALL